MAAVSALFHGGKKRQRIGFIQTESGKHCIGRPSVAQFRGTGFGAYRQPGEVFVSVAVDHIVTHKFPQLFSSAGSHQSACCVGLCAVSGASAGRDSGNQVRFRRAAATGDHAHEGHKAAGIHSIVMLSDRTPCDLRTGCISQIKVSLFRGNTVKLNTVC